GIFSYQLGKLDENFDAYNLSYATLTNYTELIEVAEENDYIEEEQKEILHAWRKDPENWLK
ncbi:orotate phosphoribosyltransferase, partial [Lactobacillus salivarius]|nr:orotate phosphoribosyltransferase [Ligilactobacillus salivarius]